MSKLYLIGFLALLMLGYAVGQDIVYDDCFDEIVTTKVNSAKSLGLALGDKMEMHSNSICQFDTYGDVMLEFWTSSIIVGYYTYIGEFDNCTIQGSE